MNKKDLKLNAINFKSTDNFNDREREGLKDINKTIDYDDEQFMDNHGR